MRWLFVLLVCLNVGYFVWGQVQSSVVGPATPAHVGTESTGDAAAVSLRLLTKASASGVDPAFTAAKSPSATVLPADIELVTGAECWIVGPMPEKVTAKQVQLRFQEQGIVATLLAIPRKGAQGFGLYLTPSSEKAEAVTLVRVLQLAGFASARVTPNESGFDIQIGHYDSLSNAEETLRLLQEQGYVATVREQYSEISEPLLRVVLKQGQAVPNELWGSLDSDFSQLGRQKNRCGAIASVG